MYERKKRRGCRITFIWTLYMYLCLYRIQRYTMNEIYIYIYDCLGGGGTSYTKERCTFYVLLLINSNLKLIRDLIVQAWLVVLVVLPARSSILMRFGLVAYLSLLSILILPRHVWMVRIGF